MKNNVIELQTDQLLEAMQQLNIIAKAMGYEVIIEFIKEN
jgi:hypothetical protein